MLPQNILFALASAGLISALPLNINLGAYSPALVVGDGEISLGGAQSAGELMETLASGAATAAQSGTAAAPAAEPSASGEGAAKAAQPPAAGQVTQGVNPATLGQSQSAADLARPAGAQANEVIPEGPQVAVVEPGKDNATGGMISKGMEPSLKIPSSALLPRPNMQKRDEPELEARAPAPALSTVDHNVIKRELQGFNAALNYAINAMKNQPAVELGTGQEGSGVGVIVNPGVSVPNGVPAAGRVTAAARETLKEKRYVMPGAPMGASAEQPKSGITLMAIAEI